MTSARTERQAPQPAATDAPAGPARYIPGEPPRAPTMAEARALAHPLRLRILRLCVDQAMTNQELATALEERPGTLLHHVRTLVNTGFLRQEAARPGPRGTTEKPYRATGKSWWLEHAMDSGDGTVLQAIFQAVAAEIRETPPDGIVEGASMAMRLRPEQLDSVIQHARSLIKECETSDSPEGDPYAMLLVIHRRPPPKPDRAPTC